MAGSAGADRTLAARRCNETRTEEAHQQTDGHIGLWLDISGSTSCIVGPIEPVLPSVNPIVGYITVALADVAPVLRRVPFFQIFAVFRANAVTILVFRSLQSADRVRRNRIRLLRNRTAANKPEGGRRNYDIWNCTLHDLLLNAWLGRAIAQKCCRFNESRTVSHGPV